ncbi:MAG: hypothetical protein ACI915_003398, partial [Gammaproteobacteria bacterium]
KASLPLASRPRNLEESPTRCIVNCRRTCNVFQHAIMVTHTPMRTEKC